ncbi:hypothetical protein DdX_18099 [Ditylenchus destructor]|uniref:Uncharacterized protein n=1 Tax=Ditylenchus destructor TaxID=166010 RepID=A0AAD4MQQ6_9BILA|nr:hypothetical protein DdX_18099 [Ditylenchus destructor]
MSEFTRNFTIRDWHTKRDWHCSDYHNSGYAGLKLTQNSTNVDVEGWIRRAKRHKTEFELKSDGTRSLKPFQCEFASFISMEDLYNTSKGFKGTNDCLEFELRVALEEINGKIYKHSRCFTELEDKTAALEREIGLMNQAIAEDKEKIPTLEREIGLVNQTIAENGEKIPTLEEAVIVATQKVTDHDQKFGELEASSSEITAMLQQAVARISAVEAKNISLQAQINSLPNQSRNAHDSRQSMFSSFVSLCMNYISLKVIGFACVLVPVAIVLSSVDFGSKWTWFILFSIIALGIYAYILYQKAKESHAAWVTQLNSILAQLLDWWNSASTACQSYFDKKDAKIDAILDSTIQIFGTTQMILDQVPETQQTVREAFQAIGTFAVTMTEYTRRLGDETSDCIGEFKQQMITSSENFNRLSVELTNTARIAGATIERAEENFHWQVGNFLNAIGGSADQFSNALALNANTGRGELQALAQNFCQALCMQFGTLVDGVNRGIENGQFKPYVHAPISARASVPVKICTIL